MSGRVLFCCLFALFFSFLSHQTFSQTHIPEKIQFKHLTKENGLSDNFIMSILKDSKGFIWIGTLDGLNRYDGKEFKVYRYSIGDPNSLGANEIHALCEDKSGALWVGTTGGGLNRYNYEQDNFTRFVNPNDSTALANSIMAIISDKQGTLWLGTHHGGLHNFNPKTEKFKSFVNIPGDSTSLSHNFIWTLYEDSKDNIWIGTVGGGLNKFIREKQNFIRYQHDPNNPNSLSNDLVPGICEDKSGAIWLGTYGGGISKLTFSGKNHSPVFTNLKYDLGSPAGISGNNIDYILIDENNILWFGTAQGGLSRTVSSLDNNLKLSFISYKQDPNDPSSLLGNSIPFILKDNSGVFWIASYGQGLNIYNSKQKQFRNYKPEPGNPFSLKGDRVTSLFEDKAGDVWLGTWNGGLNKWDRKTNRFYNYLHNPNDPNSISEDQATSLCEDKEGYVWIGTYGDGLNKFDKRTGKFFRYTYDPLNPATVSDVTFDRGIVEDKKSGLLWIGTANKGFNIYDRETNSFFNINNNPDSLKILSSNLYTSIRLIDRAGTFWITTKAGGLITYDPKKDELTHYDYNSDNPEGLSHKIISSVYEDKSGFYWIGTDGGGLNKLDKSKNQFKRYLMKDGLPGDGIGSILEDEHRNLWISTNNGLSKFNPATESFRNYNVEDGLLSNQIGGGRKIKTGEMIFICGSGFVIFHPDSIKDNPDIPLVYITDFYLFNKPVPIGYDSLSGRIILSKSIIECEEIELNNDDKVFSFEFTALDYHAPMKNKYAYKMEGFDKGWTYTDASRNLATYTNLDPGEYTFRVKGSNNDGVWNETGASLKIIILPPWYQTMWAYLFYILLTAGIVFFIWKAQLRRIRIKSEYKMSRFEAQKLHEVDELKSRFFTNISHEFRTPLTLILGPAKQLIEKIKDEKIKSEISMIHRNARKLLGLVNQLLDISKLESGNMKLRTSPENIVSLVKALVLSFVSYAERKRITLKVNSSEDEIKVYLDKEKFEKIVTNILSNAFKFTANGGRIEATVQRDTQYVNVSVSDTGIGIPKENMAKIFDRFYQVDRGHTREHEGTGIGLSLTKELVELHKGKIEVESEEGKGTMFILSIPLGTGHLKSEEIIKKDYEYQKVPIEYEEEIKRIPEQIIDIEYSEKMTLPLLLITEDNDDVRFYIKENLQQEYRILEAVDGEDGWNKAIEQIPDLIVSDVMMPGMDGFKLCEKLKTDSRTSHIPVILLTAKAAKEDKLEGYETGADDYIMKPFDTDELKARIKNLIEQRKRLHENFRKEGIYGLDQTRITSVDKKFLQKVYEIISQNISNESFSVEVFAKNLSVSKSLLHKKIVSLTGEPPVEFIKRIRLNKAASLIVQKFGNLSEIALEVGFSNPAYFSECFKKQFGVPPSQYQRNNYSA